jgi:hypothetical protein
MEPEGSLLQLQEPATCPYPELLKPVHATSHLLNIHFNIILPSMPPSPKWSRSLRSPYQNPVRNSPFRPTCYMPRPNLISFFRCLCRTKESVQVRGFVGCFVTWCFFYSEELLAPRTTPKLEGHILSAVRDFLFNIFATTLHIWRPFLHPQPEDAPCRGDRDPLSAVFSAYKIKLRNLTQFDLSMIHQIKPGFWFAELDLVCKVYGLYRCWKCLLYRVHKIMLAWQCFVCTAVYIFHLRSYTTDVDETWLWELH